MRLSYCRLLLATASIATLASLATAALLNVIITPPAINSFSNTPNGTQYDATSHAFSVTADAAFLQVVPSGPVFIINGISSLWGALTLDVLIDNGGNLVGGVMGPDLIISGSVVINGVPYSGNLLTGEASDFGYQDAGQTDLFDFRFITTGGLLTAPGAPFHGKDIGLLLTSENSSFEGSFSADFAGQSKVVVGAIAPPTGGCTPGYWKQSQHFHNWPAPYTPNTPFKNVFGNCSKIPGNPTLVQALALNGGKMNALMRHSVAALLNAAHPGFSPAPAFDTPAKVIAAFQAACASGNNGVIENTKNQMEASNELGCPL